MNRRKTVERDAWLYELRAGPLLVRSASRTVTGIRRESGKHLTVERDPEAIGRALLSALTESRDGIPDFEDVTSDDLAMLAVAGVRTYDGFDRKVRAVAVEQTGTNLRVVPCDNEAGLLHNYGKSISVRAPLTTEKVGKAALKALERASFRT